MMLRSNIDVTKGLVNGAIVHVTEIIWPLFHRAGMSPEGRMVTYVVMRAAHN